MYEKDYVLRLATQAALVLARLLGLKTAGEYQEALALIDETLQDELGLTFVLADHLSARELILILKGGLTLDVNKAMFLAALLKETGDILAAEKMTVESHRAYLKALQVALETLSEADESASREHLPLIEALTEQLSRSEMDSDTRDELYDYFQRIGESRKARDYLSGLPG